MSDLSRDAVVLDDFGRGLRPLMTLHLPCIAGSVLVLSGLFLLQSYVLLGVLDYSLLGLPAAAGLLLGCALAHLLMQHRGRVEPAARTVAADRSAADVASRATPARASFAVWDWDCDAGTVRYAPVVPGQTKPEDEPYTLPYLGWIGQVHSGDRQGYLRCLHDHVAGKSEWFEYEYRLRTPDETEVWVVDRGRATRNAEGRVQRVTGLSTDASERRQAETSLKEALLMARSADRAKRDFLANMNHEMRTPLNAILGFSEVMIQQGFGPLGSQRYRDYARDIHDSGTHLLSIIEDVLEHRQAELGEIELQESIVDLGGVLQFAYDSLSQQAEKKDVVLSLEIADEGRMCRCDEHAMRQIVLKLVSNGVKFTPAGGTVRVLVATPDAEGLAIIVVDNGVGIAREDLKRLGEPFFQGGEAITREHDGAGLGLARVKALVDRHQGRLSIDSTPGEGTRVEVRLPRERCISNGLHHLVAAQVSASVM